MPQYIWNTSNIPGSIRAAAVILNRSPRWNLFEMKHRSVYPFTTHDSHTLLDSARSGATSSLDSTSFGSRRTAFPSVTSPWLDVCRASQLARRHKLLSNNHRAGLWSKDGCGFIAQRPKCGRLHWLAWWAPVRILAPKQTVCNYRIAAQSGHQALWA